jgi:Sec-independent protein translocase protein TatA
MIGNTELLLIIGDGLLLFGLKHLKKLVAEAKELKAEWDNNGVSDHSRTQPGT